jgi:hypothetical protein
LALVAQLRWHYVQASGFWDSAQLTSARSFGACRQIFSLRLFFSYLFVPPHIYTSIQKSFEIMDVLLAQSITVLVTAGVVVVGFGMMAAASFYW